MGLRASHKPVLQPCSQVWSSYRPGRRRAACCWALPPGPCVVCYAHSLTPCGAQQQLATLPSPGSAGSAPARPQLSLTPRPCARRADLIHRAPHVRAALQLRQRVHSNLARGACTSLERLLPTEGLASANHRQHVRTDNRNPGLVTIQNLRTGLDTHHWSHPSADKQISSETQTWRWDGNVLALLFVRHHPAPDLRSNHDLLLLDTGMGCCTSVVLFTSP